MSKSTTLKPNQVKILQAIVNGGSVTRKQIAAKTGIRKGFARLMGAGTQDEVYEDTLEGMGLVTSSWYEGDRNLYYVATNKGEAVIKQVA